MSAQVNAKDGIGYSQSAQISTNVKFPILDHICDFHDLCLAESEVFFFFFNEYFCFLTKIVLFCVC